MTNDEYPTEMAPPPSDTEPSTPDTQPPGSSDADTLVALKTMLPAGPSKLPHPPSYFEDAARNFGEALLELRATRKEIANNFVVQGSKLDVIKREFASNYQLLTGEFKSFRAIMEARLDDGERRFCEIEELLKDLKKEQLDAAQRQIDAAHKITNLEIESAQLKAYGHDRAATPPTT